MPRAIARIAKPVGTGITGKCPSAEEKPGPRSITARTQHKCRAVGAFVRN